MHTNGTALRQLSRDECLRLMGSVSVGRIIYTRQALPAVELVSFALVDGDIIIQADYTGKLAAATRGAVVAFEADSVDLTRRTGWSVTAVGRSQQVTDREEIARLGHLDFSSWVPGERAQFIRISSSILTGRLLSRDETTSGTNGPGPADPRPDGVSPAACL
jgi:hypothetical protein